MYFANNLLLPQETKSLCQPTFKIPTKAYDGTLMSLHMLLLPSTFTYDVKRTCIIIDQKFAIGFSSHTWPIKRIK